MINTKQYKEVWTYYHGDVIVCEFLTIQECGKYEAWADVRRMCRVKELRGLDHVLKTDREYDRHAMAWKREPEWHEPLPPITKDTSMSEIFTSGEFIGRALKASDFLKEVIERPTVNHQMADWQARDKKNTADLTAGAMAMAQCFIAAIDGIGKALERAAQANEKLADFAAVDLKATVDAALTENREAIAEAAVSEYKETVTQRSFIGKPT